MNADAANAAENVLYFEPEIEMDVVFLDYLETIAETETAARSESALREKSYSGSSVVAEIEVRK